MSTKNTQLEQPKTLVKSRNSYVKSPNKDI